ncbi:MAG: hypothetical protein K9L85_01245 [Candidatus Peribacteraceae bacterium]|nr:hypothetical protein [Candidatus Peribacteraceae bacterium]
MKKSEQLDFLFEEQPPREVGQERAVDSVVAQSQTDTKGSIVSLFRSDQMGFPWAEKPVVRGVKKVRKNIADALIPEHESDPRALIPRQKGLLVFVAVLNDALKGFHYDPDKGRPKIILRAIIGFIKLRTSQYTLENFRKIVRVAKTNRQVENYENGAPHREVVRSARNAGVSARW